ncbi:MAG: ADOP family duplicated permease [Paludibaculum sp.]
MLKQLLIDTRVRLAALLGRRSLRRRAEEEMQFHLAMMEQRLVESGMAPELAHTEARRSFGNPTLLREQTVDSWGHAFVDTLFQDLRYAFRLAARKRGFAAIVVLTLALGIGANTAVFSIVEAVLLRPLPYKESTRLVSVWLRNVHETGTSKMFDSLRDYEAFVRARSFEQVAAATWATGGRLLRGYGPAQEILAMPVSETFFELLGAEAALGRVFVKDDLRHGCSVVVSDRLWRGPLGGDPAIAGKTIVLDDRACTVLGVMPSSFAFYPTAAQAWMLLTPDFTPSPEKIPLGIFARLRPGVSIAQAQAEVSALHAALHQSDGQERDLAPLVADLHGEFTFLAEARLRTTLWILLAAVVFVLLIVCLNIANLLLGQAVARDRELAVRAALGGGGARLARQLLTEGLLLSLGGSLAGLVVASAAIEYFRVAAPIEMPPGADIQLNWLVLVFTAVLSVVTALVFGALPAWRAARLDAVDSLRAGRGSTQASPQRAMRALIALEMALSLVLLTGAGLLVQSALKMSSEPLGFANRGLLTASVKLPAEQYQNAERRQQFYDRVLAALGEEAALSTGLPPYGLAIATLHIAGQELSGAHYVGQQSISPGYFRVMSEPLPRGRAFADRDRAGSEPVVIVNESLARRYFGAAQPLGRRIALDDPTEANPWRTIVGVVADEKRAGGFDRVGWAAMPMALKPLAQDPPRTASIVLRGAGADLRRAVAGVDETAVVGEVESMDARLGRMLAYPRFRATLLGAFALFAVLLAGVGLYGVLGQSVTQRTQEIGVPYGAGCAAGRRAAHGRGAGRRTARFRVGAWLGGGVGAQPCAGECAVWGAGRGSGDVGGGVGRADCGGWGFGIFPGAARRSD